MSARLVSINIPLAEVWKIRVLRHTLGLGNISSLRVHMCARVCVCILSLQSANRGKKQQKMLMAANT